MVFGKGRRGKKANIEAIIDDGHGDGGEAYPVDFDIPAPDRTQFNIKAADDGIKKAELRMKRDAELEAKYPHVVAGSIRAVPRGEKVGDTVSKGRVATVACVECGAKRDVNLQDVFQVLRCVTCAKAHTERRLANLRAARAAARQAKSVAPAQQELASSDELHRKD